jgi:hypothetical protein
MTTSSSVLQFPSAPLVKHHRNTLAIRELVTEHGTLLRRVAQLQQRVSDQLQTAERRQRDLEADNIRLRAELVRVRTALVWGLRPAVLARRAVSGQRLEVGDVREAMPEAQAVICQTGCVGHAHPWLGEDGQCVRSGQACERLAEDAKSPSR